MGPISFRTMLVALVAVGESIMAVAGLSEDPWVIVFGAMAVLGVALTVSIFFLTRWFDRVERHISRDHERWDKLNSWMGKMEGRYEALISVVKMHALPRAEEERDRSGDSSGVDE